MAATNSPRPRPKGLSVIKSNLLRPALTSHYDVFINEPSAPTNSDPGGYTWSKYKQENGLTGYSQDLLHLSCCNATLPGSSLMTHEQLYDYTGVTEKHAYRRAFDGKIDLTFYVMISPSNVESESGTPNRYLPIRFFEGWMKYISSEKSADIAAPNYAYRMRYPKDYYGGLSVIKYERDYSSYLTYNFLSVFPVAVNSMPVSYEASELLKTTVSLSYTRYYITDVAGSKSETEVTNKSIDGELQAKPGPQTPEQQAQQNTPKPKQGFDNFGGTDGPGTDFVERDSATGEPMVHSSIDSITRNGRVGDTVTPALRQQLQAFARGEAG